MGVVIKNTFWSTLIIYLGFAVGFFFSVQLMPQLLSKEQIGLINIFFDISSPFVALSTFGFFTIIVKLNPYYIDRLENKDNDLLSLAWWTSIVSFIILIVLGYFFRDLILQKFNKSPLLQQFFYLIPFFSLGLLNNYLLQAFHNSLKNTILISFVNELGLKTYNAILILLLFFKVIDFKVYFYLYCCTYFITSFVLYIALKKEGFSVVKFSVSNLTKKLSKIIFSTGLFFWGANFFGIASSFIDSFTLAGVNGLAETGLFTYTTKFIAIMLVTHRAVVPIATTIIAESWKKNDLKNLHDIYKRSALNLVLLGGFIFIGISSNLKTYIENFLPAGYDEIYPIFVILGIAKLIDFMTGINGEIIIMSRKYWKVSFFSQLVLVILLIPCNIFLISRMGGIGAAYANLLAFSVYNLLSCSYLYYKTKMTPLSKQLYYSIGLITIIALLFNFLPLDYKIFQNYKINALFLMVFKGILITFFYIGSIYWFNLSNDIKGIIDKSINFVKSKMI